MGRARLDYAAPRGFLGGLLPVGLQVEVASAESGIEERERGGVKAGVAEVSEMWKDVIFNENQAAVCGHHVFMKGCKKKTK